MRVVFMGTPDFAAAALQAIVEAGHQVVAVYCQPPRPAGRGQQPRPTAVQACATRLGLPVLMPVSLKDAETRAVFASHQADIAVVAAYGLLLPLPVLQAPRLGCINIHGSLLPRWRGAAPIQRSIMAGDQESGITIMQMEAGLDTGPMLLMERLPVTDETTAGSLHDALMEMGARLVVEALARLEQGDLPPVVQPEEGVTYAAKISKDEARICWDRPAAEVARQINGLSPFPGAWCEVRGERLKILQARPLPLPARASAAVAPGITLDDRGCVACADGSAVQLLRLQRAGKAALDLEAALRGFSLPAGTSLG